MKATEQYVSVVVFNMLYKLVLTFESISEIPKCFFFSNIFQTDLEFLYIERSRAGSKSENSSVFKYKER